MEGSSDDCRSARRRADLRSAHLPLAMTALWGAPTQHPGPSQEALAFSVLDGFVLWAVQKIADRVINEGSLNGETGETGEICEIEARQEVKE